MPMHPAVTGTLANLFGLALGASPTISSVEAASAQDVRSLTSALDDAALLEQLGQNIQVAWEDSFIPFVTSQKKMSRVDESTLPQQA